MTGAVAERVHFDESELLTAVAEYIRDNRNSQSVARRWLTAWLESGVIPAVGQVRTAEHEPETKALICEHRLAEIAAERATRQAELDRLDREARMLTETRATEARA